MFREVLEKGMHRKPICVAFEISERQVYEKHGAGFIRMLTRDDPSLGLEQDLAGVLSRSHEAGIQQLTVFVASELNLRAGEELESFAARAVSGALVSDEKG